MEILRKLFLCSFFAMMLAPLAGCEVEVNEGPLEDATEELADD